MRISLEIDFRPVLKIDKKSVMGAGRAELLRKIKETGSLSTAAKSMGMSYRHAWGVIHHMEDIVGEKLVESRRGGKRFGESVLTKTGERLLEEFDSRTTSSAEASEKSRKKPSLTTDGILVVDNKICLIKRKHAPFSGMYALPGGFVEYGERLEESVVREFKEETGLDVKVKSLLGVYSDPNRDPRGHTVSVVYVLSHIGGKLSDSDETIAEWVPLSRLPKLAFDHEKIVSDYLAQVKKSKKS
ncbi:MAG: NUDIX domain-containing protein [Thermoplasmata archaeon]